MIELFLMTMGIFWMVAAILAVVAGFIFLCAAEIERLAFAATAVVLFTILCIWAVSSHIEFTEKHKPKASVTAEAE